MPSRPTPASARSSGGPSGCSRSTTPRPPTPTTAWARPWSNRSGYSPIPTRARPRGGARRPRGAVRAARGHRARLHRGPPAPSRAPARRAHPPRRARLLGARGRRGARDDAGRGRQRAAARAPGGGRAAPRAQPAGTASLAGRPGPARDRRPLRRRLGACRRRGRRRDADLGRGDDDAAASHLVPGARGRDRVPRGRCAEEGPALAPRSGSGERAAGVRQVPLGRGAGDLRAAQHQRAHARRRRRSPSSPPSSIRS